jgi:two-component system NtrC family sensor kinase
VARGKRAWETTFDAIADGISIHNADFRIVRANRTLAKWFGTTPQELIGRPCYEVIHQQSEPPAFCPHRQALESGQPAQREWQDGRSGRTYLISFYPLPDTQGPAGNVHILRDITEQKQAEESRLQLVESAKLAATGRLAASLAHEINNPLQVLHNSLQLLLSFSLEPAEQREYLQIAAEEVERLMGITAHILDFARRPPAAMRPTHLPEVVGQVLALTGKYLQHAQVVLEHDVPDNLPPVRGNAQELGQVLLNLVLNAVEAMPGGGRLRVAGRSTADGRVALALSDTGHGIPPEQQERIFEPFFSTKEEGTGLGLSVAYGIIERHGGEITVESQVGGGSTFTVWLPPLVEEHADGR